MDLQSNLGEEIENCLSVEINNQLKNPESLITIFPNLDEHFITTNYQTRKQVNSK